MTWDQACIGRQLPRASEPAEVAYFCQQHCRREFAYPRNRDEQIPLPAQDGMSFQMPLDAIPDLAELGLKRVEHGLDRLANGSVFGRVETISVLVPPSGRVRPDAEPVP